MKHAAFLFLGILTIILYQACAPPNLYSQKFEFDDGIWKYSDTLNNSWNVQDTSQVYDLFVRINHEPNFAYQNLYIKLLSKFPDSDWIEQISPINLAMNSGKWLGKCGNSDCTIEYNLQEKAFFKSEGIHELMILQFGREDQLLGINSIELIIQESK